MYECNGVVGYVWGGIMTLIGSMYTSIELSYRIEFRGITGYVCAISPFVEPVYTSIELKLQDRTRGHHMPCTKISHVECIPYFIDSLGNSSRIDYDIVFLNLVSLMCCYQSVSINFRLVELIYENPVQKLT